MYNVVHNALCHRDFVLEDAYTVPKSAEHGLMSTTLGLQYSRVANIGVH